LCPGRIPLQDRGYGKSARQIAEEVCSLRKEPERLRVGIERYIEQENRGDPEREMRLWAKRLADVDDKRSRYQDMAAEGLIDFDELRAKLDALETDRKTAARELEAVRDKADQLASLKLKSDALVGAYSRKARLGLGLYTPQDRFDAYKALGVNVIAHPDGTRELIVGMLCLSSGCPVVTQKVEENGLQRHRRN
jgi:hypothetical protein